uniref:Uncharacterized protein n=1 Tax=Anguilla anguilla TaxID=7936 RepID=A0A0E9TLS5_ANGAN
MDSSQIFSSLSKGTSCARTLR